MDVSALCARASTMEPKDCGASSPGLGQGPPLPQLLKNVRLNRPSGNVPEPENPTPEKGSVPNGAVVSIDGRHRFSNIPRLSITLTGGHGIEGDAHYGPFMRHRYLARRNPKAPNLRQVHFIPSELFDGARCFGLALQRRSNLPASARPASSSIASSPD
jgi:hypothetical protein